LIPFSEIVGQERAKRILKQAMAGKRLPHAYLFTGIAGIGKSTAARALYMALNCESPRKGDACGECASCRRSLHGNATDFISIRSEFNHQNIRTEQIREELNRALAFAPLGRYRVCVVHDAERMTPEAANSFLKTLEEPPPGNILVVKAVEPLNLLPTVVSRCQRVAFQPIPVRDIASWLIRERQVEEESAGVLAAISGGSLGAALEMVEGNFLEKRRQWIYEFTKLPDMLKEEALGRAVQWAEEYKSLDKSKSPGTDMLSVWETGFRDLLMLKAGAPARLLINRDFSDKLKKLAKKPTIKSLRSSVLAVERAGQEIRRYRNVNLVLADTVLRVINAMGQSGAEGGQ